MKKKDFSSVNNSQSDPIYLYPSQVIISREPTIIKTVLGSCVSVCLWDQVLKIGGINHFMLPFWNGEGLPSPKYGNIAIEKLFEKMMAAGCKLSGIKAKVFGGSDNLDHHYNYFKIGSRNVETAKNSLSDLNIPIVASSVGGTIGRNIQFNTYTGEVFMKYIQKDLFNEITIV